MKTIIQRVKKASVTINSKERREISTGFVVFVGFSKNDNADICKKIFDKITKMRIFANDDGKFDKSAEDINGEFLIISQFTLYANCKKGNRPDFMEAAGFEQGKNLYDEFLRIAKNSAIKIVSGEFGADMLVEIHNDGPVTIVLNSEDL